MHIVRSKIWIQGDNEPSHRPAIIELCRRDFSFWRPNFAVTQDEHDKRNPFKLFPDKEYLYYLDRLLMEEKLLFLEKSRQMLISLHVCSYCAWMAQFHIGQKILLQGKKEDDAKDLIKRVVTNLERQPEWMKRPFKHNKLEIDFPDQHCLIRGIPTGGAQIASQVPSLLFMDEVAQMPEASEAYARAQPCLTGGGQLIAVSSSDVSWFRDMMEGKVSALARAKEFELPTEKQNLTEQLLRCYGIAS